MRPLEETSHIAAVLADQYATLLPQLPVPVDTETMVRYGASATPTFVLGPRLLRWSWDGLQG